MTAAEVLVTAPGLLTSIQDTGRWGYQHLGVSVSGAMDVISHRRANQLVGNAPSAASLEVTLAGPTLEFRADVRVVVSGAEFELRLAEYAVSPDTVIHATRGQQLSFGRRIAGARAYVAAAGGFDVGPVLGSRSTHLGSRMGGVEGRALRAGDVLPVGRPSGRPGRTSSARAWDVRPIGGARVRVLLGPHEDAFDRDALDALEGERYVVSPNSDRMGYRLEGAPIIARSGRELLSQAIPLGAVQVPRAGHPIIAMADRQTSGGYPRIATVISADIPRLGQLAPGDWVEFERCDQETARAALRTSELHFFDQVP